MTSNLSITGQLKLYYEASNRKEGNLHFFATIVAFTYLRFTVRSITTKVGTATADCIKYISAP